MSVLSEETAGASLAADADPLSIAAVTSRVGYTGLLEPDNPGQTRHDSSLETQWIRQLVACYPAEIPGSLAHPITPDTLIPVMYWSTLSTYQNGTEHIDLVPLWMLAAGETAFLRAYLSTPPDDAELATTLLGSEQAPYRWHIKIFWGDEQSAGTFSDYNRKQLADAVPADKTSCFPMHTLTWAPSSDSDQGTSYRTVRWGNGMVERVVADTQCTYTELSTGKLHLFVVRAQDEAGNKSISREVLFKTKGPASGQELPAPHVTLSPQTSTSVLLQWEYETGDTMGMRITVNGEYHSEVSRPFKTKVVKNLPPGVSNTISVIAYTLLAGDLSEPTVLLYKSQGSTTFAPEGLRVTASAPGSVTLVWDELEGDSGMRGCLLFNNHKHVGSTLGTQYTVCGLSPGLHSFSLRSLNLDGSIAELTTIIINVT